MIIEKKRNFFFERVPLAQKVPLLFSFLHPISFPNDSFLLQAAFLKVSKLIILPLII